MAAAEKILDVIDDAQEIIEETVDAVEGVYDWRCGLSRKQHVAQLVGVGVIAAGVAGYLAYRFTQKRLEVRYDSLVTEEVAKTRAFYNNAIKEIRTPAAVAREAGVSPDVAEAADALLQYQGQETEEEIADGSDEHTETTVSNIFTQIEVDDDFDLEAEMERRSSAYPYIITAEEHMQNELDYEQTTLTYYAGDHILTDERDKPIQLVDKAVKQENLKRFGHGSGDARTLYVRNEQMESDFEIVLHEGSYASEVLGFDQANTRRGSD